MAPSPLLAKQQSALGGIPGDPSVRSPILAVLLALSVAPTAALAVECGDVLVEDTVLHHDLECPGDGLVIGADNITLDLGGHQLAGPATWDGDSVGIRNDGYDSVRVLNGTVRAFRKGIVIRGSKRSLVTGLNVTRNAQEGILLERAHRTVVANNHVSYNIDPGEIRLVSSDWNWIVSNSLRGDADTGPAIALEDSHHNRVLRNYANGHDDSCILVRESNWNRVQNNDVGNSNGTCVSIQRAVGTLIADNLVQGDFFALEVSSSRDTRIVRNQISKAFGVSSSVMTRVIGNVLRSEVSIFRADRSLIRFNEVTGEVAIQESSRAVVESNIVDGGGRHADGILVDAGSDHIRIVDNLVFDARDDGIDASGKKVVLRGNTAIENGDYGIEAAPGVIDGGGNLAYDNGNPEQCLNVSCD
jgi:parallel beta-helix repeat protein